FCCYTVPRFFCFVTRRPPSSPLFPYTTLFRSFGLRSVASGHIYKDGKELKIKSPRDAIKHHIALLTEERRVTGIFPVLSVKDNTDRKSTRLNSSHVKISYAVFCLKKKNKT